MAKPSPPFLPFMLFWITASQAGREREQQGEGAAALPLQAGEPNSKQYLPRSGEYLPPRHFSTPQQVIHPKWGWAENGVSRNLHCIWPLRVVTEGLKWSNFQLRQFSRRIGGYVNSHRNLRQNERHVTKDRMTNRLVDYSTTIHSDLISRLWST